MIVKTAKLPQNDNKIIRDLIRKGCESPLKEKYDHKNMLNGHKQIQNDHKRYKMTTKNTKSQQNDRNNHTLT